MKEWHGMVLAKNKKIMISTIPLVILSLVCFKENLSAQASTKSLDTGESSVSYTHLTLPTILLV